MHITIAVSTDSGDLTVKRSFNLSDDKTDHNCVYKRNRRIQAIATLLNVTIAFAEELERKAVEDEEPIDNDLICVCRHHKNPTECPHFMTLLYREMHGFCEQRGQKE